ncbi:hypothetical protein Tco_1026171 [Tanacetum coccineum]
MEECYKALSDQLDWTNPEGDRCPYDLSKPLPFKGRPGHLTVPAEHFFNNDLEYLKSKNLERKYTKEVYYVNYKHKGCKGPKRQLFYKSQINRLFRHDVYSTLKIQCVVSVMVDKQFGYGYLEEIVLFHLDGDAIVNLAVALRMFTRRIVIQKRVEDVQLGVESYQKKLNTTKPQRDFPTISAKEPYTPSFDPQGFVRDTLHHRLLNFRLGYDKDMPRRKWTDTDQRQSGIMVNLIDKQLLERRIMRNLERLVGARELERDYMLMQWTI